MPHAGQVIEGFDGFRLRLIRTADETGGELLEMEASYGGTGGLPAAHWQPSQLERFEVPDGTVHQMAGDGPARVHWEITPALRTAEFFERLFSGAGEDLREEFAA